MNLRYLRYFLFFLSFLIFAYATQVFLQNFNMDSWIQELKKTQSELSWETFWIKNYYEPFLKSKYANFIFKHRSSIALDNEILIKFEKNEFDDNDLQKNIKNVNTNSDSNSANKQWLDFFTEMKWFIY